MLLREAFILELKKRAAYVASFWLKMIVPPLAQVGVAFFLWGAIYESTGQTSIGNYTFAQMIFYYILVSCVYQMTRPDMGSMLREIYEGTLTKFLVYPVSFISFKLSAHAAHMTLVALQLLFGIGVYSIFFNISDAISATSVEIILSLFALLIAGYLFFMIMACLELLSFWLESAWALCIMLEFIVNLFGGKILPLDLFPTWLQSVTDVLPFRYLVSFPVEVLQGHVPENQLLVSFVIALGWCAVFSITAKMIWEKGSYQYSGTGM